MNSIKSFYLIAVGMAFLGLPQDHAAVASDSTIPEWESSPVVDGRLDDPCWKTALRLDSFRQVTGAAPSETTIALIGQDRRWLYIGLQCRDSRISGLSARQLEFDGTVNTDDSAEIFIDPGTEGRRYYHFLVNARGVAADQKVEKGEKQRDWNSGIRAVGSLTDREWTSEIAIPLTVFEGSGAGRTWTFNVCRNLRSAGREEFLSWAEGVHNFHDPEKFKPLGGIESVKAEPVFAPFLVSAEAQPYSISATGMWYEIRAVFGNRGGATGMVDLVAREKTAGGAIHFVEQRAPCGGNEIRREIFRMPVDIPENRDARVELCRPNRPEPIGGCGVQGMDELRVFDAYSDRNYYSRETNLCLFAIWRVAVSEERLKDMKLQWAVYGTNENEFICSKETIGPSGTLDRMEFPIRDLPAGAYSGKVSLIRADGRLLAKDSITLVKRAPGSGSEVKIDYLNECLLVNNKPFFPFGFFHNEGTDESLRKLADGGFNSFIRWCNGATPEQETALLDRAEKHGIKVIERCDVFYRGDRPGPMESTLPEVWEPTLEALESSIPSIRDHPALLAYSSVDEPGDPGWERWCREVFQVCRRQDPYHPVYTSFSRRVAYTNWYEFNDMVGAHIYWQPSLQTPNMEACYARDVCRAVDRYRTPAFINPNAMLWNKCSRPPSPDEQRAVTYLTWIHGSKGTLFFVWVPTVHPDMWGALSGLAAEARVLTPALLAKEPFQSVNYFPAAPADGTGLPIVQVVLKQDPENDMVLLAANSTPDPVEVSFLIGGQDWQGPARRMFETNAVFTVEGRRFSDHIEGFGTRAYRLDGLRDDISIRWRVTVTVAGPALAAAKKRIEACEGNENLVINPGFETEEGWTPSAEGDWKKAEQSGVLPSFRFVEDLDQGRNEKDAVVAHSGRRCLEFIRPSEMAHYRCVSRPMNLKPKTVYQAGFFYRTDLLEENPKYWGGPDMCVYDMDRKKSLFSLQTRGVSGETVWEERSGTFSTGADGCTNAVLFIGGPKTVGAAWMDDLYVREQGAVPEKKKRNLLLNSSFEHATLRLWPDYWRAYWMHQLPFGDIAQDFEQAWHGQCSFRLAAPYDNAWGALASYRRAPNGWQEVKWNTPYVFSVYAKRGSEGQRLQMRVADAYGGGEVKKEFDLTPDWKRYVLPLTIPAGKSFHAWTLVYIEAGPLRKGNLWLDAAQFEEGTEPTEYEAAEKTQ